MSNYKILLTLKNGYQLDLRQGNFADLIGFERKIVTATDLGTKNANITNSVDAIFINTDVVRDGRVSGDLSGTVAVIPMEAKEPSLPFSYKERTFFTTKYHRR